MIHQQLLPPKQLLFHIMITSEKFLSRLSRSFQDIPEAKKCAAAAHPGQIKNKAFKNVENLLFFRRFLPGIFAPYIDKPKKLCHNVLS